MRYENIPNPTTVTHEGASHTANSIQAIEHISHESRYENKIRTMTRDLKSNFDCIDKRRDKSLCYILLPKAQPAQVLTYNLCASHTLRGTWEWLKTECRNQTSSFAVHVTRMCEWILFSGTCGNYGVTKYFIFWVQRQCCQPCRTSGNMAILLGNDVSCAILRHL